MQLQVSLPKKIVITVVIMAVLILFVFYFNVPNPNMILIAGLVLCSALFGYGGGIVAAAIMLGYTLCFFFHGSQLYAVHAGEYAEGPCFADWHRCGYAAGLRAEKIGDP